MTTRQRSRAEDRAIQALQREGLTRSQVRERMAGGLGLGGGPVRRSNARLATLRADALPVSIGNKRMTHQQAQAVTAAIGGGQSAARAAAEARKSGVRVGRDFILAQRRRTGDPNDLRRRPIPVKVDGPFGGRQFVYQAVGRRIDGTVIYMNLAEETPLSRERLNTSMGGMLRRNLSEGSVAAAAAPESLAQGLRPGEWHLLARLEQTND